LEKKKKIDGDDAGHIQFIQEAAVEHAKKFGLDHTAVTTRLTQGVVKRIIPAIASTNACVSAACAAEALKITTEIYQAMDNFTNFAGNDGCFSGVTSNERNSSCLVCGRETVTVKFPGERSLQDFVDFIIKDKGVFNFFQKPSLLWDDEDSVFPYIYMPNKNKMLMDLTLLDKPIQQSLTQDVVFILNEPVKKRNTKTGQMDFEAFRSFRIKLQYVPLSLWLLDHQEWVDLWGSNIDKLVQKK